MDSKFLKEKEEERDELIEKKSTKLTVLGDLEQELHEKESINSQLRKQLEMLRERNE